MNQPNEDTVGSIYDAALDRKRWPGALERMRRFIGVTAIQLMAVDRKLGTISFSATANVSEDAELEYVRRYCAIDPRVRVLLGDAPGTWLYCHELLSDAFVAQDPFYQGLIIPNGLRYVAGCKVYEDENISMVLGLHQGLGLPPVSREQTARADLLAPHLERATRIALNLSLHSYSYSSQALVGVDIVNRLRYPVFLLNTDGRLVHMNTGACDMLREPDSLLCLEENYLTCGEPAAARRMANALRGLEAGAPALSSTPSTSSPSSAGQVLSLERLGKRPLKGLISPLHPQSVMGVFGPQRLMLAAFSDPGKSALPDASFLMAAYGLTPAEARVTILVALGKSVKEIALELGVQPTTVRTQLDNVFRKTGTAKQAEMVAEVLSLPGMWVGQTMEAVQAVKTVKVAVRETLYPLAALH